MKTLTNPVSEELRNQLREEWIAALESDTYVQGRGHLHTVSDSGTHEYCCLGVACEIAVKHGLIERNGRDGSVYGLANKTTHYLCREAVQYLGMYGDTGAPKMSAFNVEDPFEAMSLATYNDKLDLPFTEIAKILRERRSLYFDPEKSNQQIPLPT